MKNNFFFKALMLLIILVLPFFVAVSSVSADDSINNNKVIVYYFHNNFRCSSCLKIEKYTQQALDAYFAPELKDGTIVYKVINFDNKDDKHFVDDYQLYTKSVILSKVVNGKQIRWKNLDKIWQVLGNKDQFMKYIKDELDTFQRAK